MATTQTLGGNQGLGPGPLEGIGEVTMAAGALMTMPVLIVNMGGEMVYILAQRLQAQQIPSSKGQKVLCDVVRTMYYPRFIEELFKPQEIYSLQSTRQIFDRLAHSSIMRLNESSMGKLFDLMIMGFKLQLMSVSPREIIDVTNNHLEELRRLAGDGEGVSSLVEECVTQVRQAYGQMGLADLCNMRHCLATFVQDCKVKVSLFLHEGTQKSDGAFAMPSFGTLQEGALQPGTVRYFSGGQEVRREVLSTVTGNSWLPATGQRTTLGSNIYDKERRPPSSSASAPSEVQASATNTGPPAPPAPPPSPIEVAKTAAAVGELNMLASLIGGGHASTETFKLENLFGHDMFTKEGPGTSGAQVIQIDGAAAGGEHRGALDSIRDELEVPAPPPPPPEEGRP